MIFNRNKKPDMVDVRELQKRGVVRIPRQSAEVPMNKEGFVELEKTQKQATEKNQSNVDFFGFSNTTTPQPEQTQSFSTQSDGYNKREVDQKITDLDNKIYKLEQRIELLEKKLDVNQPSSNVGVMGW